MKKLEEKNEIELVFILRRDLVQTLLTSSVRDFSALVTTLPSGSSPVCSVQTDGSDNQLSHKSEQGTVELMNHVFVVHACVESYCARANISDSALPSSNSLSDQREKTYTCAAIHYQDRQ